MRILELEKRAELILKNAYYISLAFQYPPKAVVLAIRYAVVSRTTKQTTKEPISQNAPLPKPIRQNGGGRNALNPIWGNLSILQRPTPNYSAEDCPIPPTD